MKNEKSGKSLFISDRASYSNSVHLFCVLLHYVQITEAMYRQNMCNDLYRLKLSNYINKYMTYVSILKIENS